MTTAQSVNENQRRQMIADAAYFRAERRAFLAGDPVADWLEAEAEIDARLHEMSHKPLLEELDERLALANGRLRAFKKKVSGMKADVRDEWIHDVDRLTHLRDNFQKKLEKLRAQGEHAGEKTKAQADKIWQEISDVIERVSSRKPKRSR